MLLAFMSRVAGPNVQDYVRQALATFGLDDDPNTPRSTGTTECDTDGKAIMGREVNGALSEAAAIGGTAALAENALRVGFTIQNKHPTEEMAWWYVGKEGAKFVLEPRGSYTLSSGRVPKNAVQASSASGTAVFAAVDW